ncbi:hypothetical protein [Rhizobium sp. 18055]|uniref:hypothetical protein n=1 Tax=Rhizobium sp. 18055 TaxID=2681403 RepID=UPI00135B7CE3|nr:hypothetical protein [Rhizobium sp. 18055]
MNYVDLSAQRGAVASEVAFLRRASAIPLRYRIFASLVFFMIAGVAVAAMLLTPARFRTTANLLVLLSDDYGARQIAGGSAALQQTAMDRDAYMSAERDILMSDGVMDEAIATVGAQVLYPDAIKPPGTLKSISRAVGEFISGFRPEENDKAKQAREVAHRAVAQSLSVDAGRSGNVISMTYENTDRDLAARFLSTLVDAYFARRSTLFSDEQAVILAQQVETKRKELAVARAELTNFRQVNAISDFVLQRELLLRRVADLNGSLEATEVSATEALARRATVLDQLNREPVAFVRRLDNQDVSVRQGDVARALEQESIRLEQELSAASVRRGDLKARIISIQRELQTFNEQESRLDNLRLRQEVLERQYAQGLQTLEDRKSIEAVAQTRRSNVKLVDIPRPADRPTTQRMLIAASGLMLALFSCVAILTLGWFSRN